MRFQILGPLSIANVEGSVMLPISKPVNLLAALLVHPNSVVSQDFLVRAVWGDEEPDAPKSALQTCVTRLRKTLFANGITGNVIDSVPGGYRISATAETLDLLDFQERVAAAEEVDDLAQRIKGLHDALTLWRNGVLCNVNSEMLHLTVLQQLTEQHLAVVERVIDLQISQGDLHGALSDLWLATRANQGNERLAEQLIATLFRSGRRTEALQEHRRANAYLQEELGIDPGPRLQKLHVAVLRGDLSADVAASPGEGGPSTFGDGSKHTPEVAFRVSSSSTEVLNKMDGTVEVPASPAGIRTRSTQSTPEPRATQRAEDPYVRADDDPVARFNAAVARLDAAALRLDAAATRFDIVTMDRPTTPTTEGV